MPLTVADFFQKADGKLHRDIPLRGFEETDGGYLLTFEDKKVKAKALVLAMPRRSLELIAETEIEAGLLTAAWKANSLTRGYGQTITKEGVTGFFIQVTKQPADGGSDV